MHNIRTHFSILNKEYVERDENAEVKHINAILHSHLRKNQHKTNEKVAQTKTEFKATTFLQLKLKYEFRFSKTSEH